MHEYKSISGVEYTFYVKAGEEDVCVSFNAPGAIFKTEDELLAKGIEESEYFKNGRVTNITERVTQPPAPEPEPAKVKESPSSTDEPSAKKEEEGETIKEKEDETIDEHTYPGVRNLLDVQEILMSKYGIEEKDIIRKPEAQAKADELNLKFPDWKR